MANYPDLRGASAIVTGGSRGIGRGIVSVLAKQGMRLLVTARSQDEGQTMWTVGSRPSSLLRGYSYEDS